MAKLGSPQTNKFSIGTAELRIGPLASANKLVQSNSVGLIDDATVEVTQNSVDLLGGFPQTVVDTAIVSQEVGITATLREYSRRNMNVLMGEAVAAYAADVSSLVVADAAAAAVAVTVTTAEGSLFATGDIVTIYNDTKAEEVTVARVESVATDTITLDAGTPLLHDYNGTTDTVYIFKAAPTAMGGLENTNYFAAQLVQSERATARPVTFNFWKAAVAAGMTFGTNATDFASTELSIKALQPAAAEYGTGGDLEHLANIIPDYPVGMYAAGNDT